MSRSGSAAGQEAEAGQTLVVAVLALFVLFAAVALVIDGGNAVAQFRATQNGADAAAEAGAVVLVLNIAGQSKTDANVLNAVQQAATHNKIQLMSSYYTDIRGDLLSGPVAVGTNGAGPPPAGAYGVRVTGRRSFQTYVAGVIGLPTMSSSADATAVGGPIEECDPDTGCALLPITFPTTSIGCDGTNKLVTDPPEGGVAWTEITDRVVVIPLCGDGPGNVGWLDWHPPWGGIGNDIIPSVNKADNDRMDIPSWQFVGQTGNSSAQELEDAVNQYSGQPILIPLFNGTCQDTPDAPQNDLSNCTNLPASSGQNIWYFLEQVATFHLCGPDNWPVGCNNAQAPDGTFHNYTQGAYLNGGDSVCGTGNGSTGCLVGKFLQDGFLLSGTVDSDYNGGPIDVHALTVNLVR